ncbi:phosphomannomutase-like [Asparagus officinalis]|uniref:phosphomannomutase-like n=1 Tax=Asparagus officinalis TaxID=4686 RepID=UPI00098E48DC|nr:phosphomannomutase-like [Asparagus officinalis]
MATSSLQRSFSLSTWHNLIRSKPSIKTTDSSIFRSLSKASISRSTPSLQKISHRRSKSRSAREMVGRTPGLIALFDVDGTLTVPRNVISQKMLEFMKELRKVVTVGVVGGSDLVKISEQLGKSVITDYDYVFAENGLVAYKNGELIGKQVSCFGLESYFLIT